MSSRRQSKVKKEGFIDAKYSSGDNNKLISKPYEEENNNDIDGLSAELQMGCIVDAVKRPPNICVETCVYEEDSETEGGTNSAQEGTIKEDAYSDDEFEDYNSDGESESGSAVKRDPKFAKSETDNRREVPQCSVKLSKSGSFMSSKGGSVTGKSCKSSNYGSLSIPKTNRINMSFTNDRLREIERHNHILLNKILRTRNVAKSSIPPPAPPVVKRPQPSAACNRKKQQRQIDTENMILLRKIQRAKSSMSSIRR
ncbi:hypothetical protein NE865_10329 [Phthorimaea operculella]|nr:hypothetical protein NE865_10329 [Phthorimaea operculella]